MLFSFSFLYLSQPTIARWSIIDAIETHGNALARFTPRQEGSPPPENGYVHAFFAAETKRSRFLPESQLLSLSITRETKLSRSLEIKHELDVFRSCIARIKTRAIIRAARKHDEFSYDDCRQGNRRASRNTRNENPRMTEHSRFSGRLSILLARGREEMRQTFHRYVHSNFFCRPSPSSILRCFLLRNNSFRVISRWMMHDDRATSPNLVFTRDSIGQRSIRRIRGTFKVGSAMQRAINRPDVSSPRLRAHLREWLSSSCGKSPSRTGHCCSNLDWILDLWYSGRNKTRWMKKGRECIRAEAIDFTFYFYVNGLRVGATLFVPGGARVCTAIGAAVDAMQH